MKLITAVAFAALVAYASAACSDIDNCDTCANPGPKCQKCPVGTVISANREACLACPTGCMTCTADANDVTTCTACSSTYYLKDGGCTYCGDGCTMCHEDADAVVVCDSCVAEGYAHDKTTAGQPCVACNTNCKTCSMLTDGTTRCSACYDYKGEQKRGYFLVKSDYSCKSCPQYCEKCSDDGNGQGICSSCYANYTIIADSSQTTYNDGEKCLKCPSTCKDCSGEIQTGSTAKCTECYPSLGLYLSSDECITCGTGCLTCDSDGLCTECDVEYRLDSGSCTACPAFCDSCSYDDDTGETTCAVCDSKYGPKLATSVTCDSCGLSNCGTCTRQSDGSYNCGGCKTGYTWNADNSACVSCGTGCDSCSWDSKLNGGSVRCTTCSTGYSATVDSYSGACTVCPSGCLTCDFEDDGTGNYTVPLNCTACTDTTTTHIDSVSSPALCVSNINNCNVGDPWQTDKCQTATDCADGYQSDIDCTSCGVSNCKTCTTDNATPLCDTCMDGFVLDSGSANCLSCSVSNCQVCTEADRTTKCETCNAGYQKTSDKTQCIKCPSNCDSCSVSGTTSSCTSCQQYNALTNAKAYVSDGNGACKACPSKCTSCTYNSDTSSTECSSGSCETGYVVNGDNVCEACPSKCTSCFYSTDDSAVVCNSNGCDTGYGRKTDKYCYECPKYCDVCAISGNDGEDTLICSDCKDSYGKNEDVCAKCPSNCATCVDVDGSMKCTACLSGYALDSADACAKCPSNCESCTAKGTLTCNDCKDGYALSVDKASCSDCGTAAFESCAKCTNIDAGSGKANCTECDSGFTLQDELENLACVDAGALQCGFGDIYDNGPECSACSTGFTLEDYICIKQCYACGDVEAGTYVDKDKCTIPTAGNSTDTDAKLISCASGICYGAYKDGQVMAGCLPKNDATGTCVGDRASGETCQSTDAATVCERCCEGDACNTYLQELDGLVDSAIATATNIVLLALASLVAMRFN